MKKTTCATCDLYEEEVEAPCHPCGHMPNRDVLPGCYGTAVGGRDGADMSHCCCVDPKPTNKDAIVARMERIEKRLDVLEEADFKRRNELIPSLPFPPRVSPTERAEP